MDRRNFLKAGLPTGAALTAVAATTTPPLRAAQSSSRILNVEDFGAKGDGRANDTNAIQRAFDKAQSHDCIYFPLGEYRVTNTVSLPPSVSVRVTGDGPGSRIVADADMQDLVRLEHPFRDGIIDYLTIDANNMAQVALRVVGGSYSRMNELDVWKPRDIGIHCGRTDDGKSGVECMITNSRITGMTQRSAEEPGSRLGILVGGNWTDGHYNNLIIKGFIDTGMELQAASNILHEVHIYRSPCFQYKHALRVKGRNTWVAQSYFDNFTHTGVELLEDNAVLQTCYFLRWEAAFGAGTVYPGVGIQIGSAETEAKHISIISNGFVCHLPDERRFDVGQPLTAVKMVNARDVISRDHTYEGTITGETTGAGRLEIPAGLNRVSVEHGLLTAPALVHLTPAGNPNGVTWWIEEMDDQRFVAHISKTAGRAMSFFWTANCRAG
jgi:hypothetical protein